MKENIEYFTGLILAAYIAISCIYTGVMIVNYLVF